MAGPPQPPAQRVQLRAVHRHRDGRHRVPRPGPHPHRPGLAPDPDRRHRAGQRGDRGRAGLDAAGRGGRHSREQRAVEGPARDPVRGRDVRYRPAAAAPAVAVLPASGPAHPEHPGHRAGRAAAVRRRHQLDGPALHLRRVPVRRHHAPRERPRPA